MGLEIHARKPDSFLHFLMLVDTVMLVFICVSAILRTLHKDVFVHV